MPITAAETDIPVVLAEALELGRAAAPSGKVANYIPELAKADPNLVGLTVHRLDGTEDVAGDAQATFTLQSVAKIFSRPCGARDGKRHSRPYVMRTQRRLISFHRPA
jgi:glutaminase